MEVAAAIFTLFFVAPASVAEKHVQSSRNDDSDKKPLHEPHFLRLRLRHDIPPRFPVSSTFDSRRS